MNTIRTQLAALLAAALLAGCAAWRAAPDEAEATPQEQQADAEARAAAAIAAAVPPISVPAASVGDWYDLGVGLAPWLAGDAPVPASQAPTRAVGLRRADGQWLALVVVQHALSGSAPCAEPTSLHVPGSDGCLRLRRDADFDHYLQRQHAVLWQWLRQRNLDGLPRAWVAQRVPGALLEAHALIDPMLLEATTRTNEDFLNAGRPGQDWAQRFAAAAQEAAGGAPLRVPPLPFSTTYTELEPESAVLLPPPQDVEPIPVATQIEPPAPRRDRQ